MRVPQCLIDNGVIVILIENDLDMITNAGYIIDPGPRGGTTGGQIVVTAPSTTSWGTPTA